MSSLIVDADAPYDSMAFGDTILRTNDNVHFYVVGNLLCYVSPFFRDLFELSRGAAAEQNEKKDGFPIIPLLDDSATLRLLLDFVYPRVKDPQLDNATLFWNVSKAAKKYCMDIIEGKLIDRIVASDLIKEEPLRIYSVATDLEWDDVANVAARNTLDIPLKDLTYVTELGSISGAGFYRFLEYRLRCDSSFEPQEEQLSIVTKHKPESSSSTSDQTPEQDGPGRFRSPSAAADLVLRSSDSVDFFVIAALIRLISPIFDEMFPLAEGGPPVIRVQENSAVLLPLLRIVYHDIDELGTEDFRLFRDVVLAVRKYKMASIERKLKKQIATSSLILSDPLRIYILATIVGLEDVQKAAALNTLSQPLGKMTYIPELKLVTGTDLYKLVRFRFKCGDEACAALKRDDKFPTYGINDWNRHIPSRHGRGSPLYLDWDGSLRLSPRGSTMVSIYAQRMKEIELRGYDFDFRHNAFPRIIKTMVSAEKVVEEAVSKVSLSTDDLN